VAAKHPKIEQPMLGVAKQPNATFQVNPKKMQAPETDVLFKFHSLLRAGKNNDQIIQAGLRVDLGKKVGEGSFGKVYKSSITDTKTGQTVTVAVKELKENADIRSINREISNMKALSEHGEFISYYGHIEYNGKVYLFQKFMDGGNLREALQTKSFATRIQLAKDTIQGIRKLQDLNKAHGDLKPENVFIGNNRAYVADVESVRHYDIRESEPIGTPYYMAPERFTDPRHYNGKLADNYSATIMTIESLTGKDPFENLSKMYPGMNMYSLMDFVQKGKMKVFMKQFLEQNMPAVKGGQFSRSQVIDTLARGLEVSPSKRTTTASDLAAVLNQF